MSVAEQQEPTRTDAELAEESRAGVLESFEELVARYETRLFNVVRRRLASTADAEDVTQEAFLKAWQNIRRYDSKCKFSTWLFSIGSRLAIDRYRRTRHEVNRQPEVDVAEIATQDPSPAAQAAGSEGWQNTWDLAEGVLTEDQHTALWLRIAEDATHEEIAEIMDRTAGAVRVLVHRAKLTLAEHLSRANRARHQPTPSRQRASGETS